MSVTGIPQGGAAPSVFIDRFRGSKGLQLSAPDAFGGHTNLLTIGSMPPGTVNGDLVLVTLLVDNSVTVTAVPASWTALKTVSAGAGSLNAYTYAFPANSANLPYTVTLSSNVLYRLIGQILVYQSVISLHDNDLAIDTNTTPPWPQNSVVPSITPYRLAGSWGMIDPGGEDLSMPATDRGVTSGGYPSGAGGGAASSGSADESNSVSPTPTYYASATGLTPDAEAVVASTFVLDYF